MKITKRQLAVKHGAIEIGMRELAAKCMERVRNYDNFKKSYL